VPPKYRFLPPSELRPMLVLGQVRFSPVCQMPDFIPAIQEDLCRHGLPRGPMQLVEQQRWEYRSDDETWSVLVMQDGVVLQTTSYESFEAFAEKLLHAVRAVLTQTEQDPHRVLQRVGLRCVHVIEPRDGEDFRFYLRPGIRGVADEAFETGSYRLQVETTGKTTVAGVDGAMVVRVVQNDQGASLSPELLGEAPKLPPRGEPGGLVTLIDMEHSIEGTFEPDADWVVERAYKLHDRLVETLHQHVLTAAAIEVCAARPMRTELSDEFRAVIAQPVARQMQELLAALSLNKSQLAEILRVTRPTVYDWLQGREPSASNAERIHALLRVLTRASVSGAAPLGARFVRMPMGLDSPSIIELLVAEDLDEDRIVRTLEQARSVGGTD
jgi:uncharacterized protein (TIGR04255 family)